MTLVTWVLILALYVLFTFAGYIVGKHSALRSVNLFLRSIEADARNNRGKPTNAVDLPGLQSAIRMFSERFR